MISSSEKPRTSLDEVVVLGVRGVVHRPRQRTPVSLDARHAAHDGELFVFKFIFGYGSFVMRTRLETRRYGHDTGVYPREASLAPDHVHGYIHSPF